MGSEGWGFEMVRGGTTGWGEGGWGEGGWGGAKRGEAGCVRAVRMAGRSMMETGFGRGAQAAHIPHFCHACEEEEGCGGGGGVEEEEDDWDGDDGWGGGGWEARRAASSA